MWYMPYRRVRHAVIVYSCLVIGVSLAAIALRFVPGAVHMENHAPAHIDGDALFAAAVALVGGLATVLGLNLAAENDGHLEIAWTRPISREAYALGVFAVDIVAMAGCIALTIVCLVAVVEAYVFGAVRPDFSGDALLRSLAFCGLPLSIYAWVAALSASLRRNRGAIAGALWPLMLALIALGAVPVAAVHAIVSDLNLVNPLSLYVATSSAPLPSLWGYAWGWAVAALLLGAALFQWRRLEL